MRARFMASAVRNEKGKCKMQNEKCKMFNGTYLFCILHFLICPLLCCTNAFGDETKSAGFITADDLRKTGFSPLAEDDSLDAWNVKAWHKGHWTIKDGVINYDGKAKGRRA